MAMAVAVAGSVTSHPPPYFRGESICSSSSSSSSSSITTTSGTNSRAAAAARFRVASNLTVPPSCRRRHDSCSHGVLMRNCLSSSPNSAAALAASQLCRRSGLSFGISWQGRSHLGDLVSVLAGRAALWRPRRSLTGGGGVRASLFGVGAPEALVIGVVALVVFGPKGLAEVARTLGKSLKAFQPTIQELQQVSREFKNTLEQEIGLDELRNPPTYQQGPPPPQQQQQRSPTQRQNGTPDAKPYTAEDYVRVTDEQAKALVPEDLRRESEAAAWGGSSAPKQTSVENGNKESAVEDRKPESES